MPKSRDELKKFVQAATALLADPDAAKNVSKIQGGFPLEARRILDHDYLQAYPQAVERYTIEDKEFFDSLINQIDTLVPETGNRRIQLNVVSGLHYTLLDLNLSKAGSQIIIPMASDDLNNIRCATDLAAKGLNVVIIGASPKLSAIQMDAMTCWQHQYRMANALLEVRDMHTRLQDITSASTSSHSRLSNWEQVPLNLTLTAQRKRETLEEFHEAVLKQHNAGLDDSICGGMTVRECKAAMQYETVKFTKADGTKVESVVNVRMLRQNIPESLQAIDKFCANASELEYNRVTAEQRIPTAAEQKNADYADRFEKRKAQTAHLVPLPDSDDDDDNEPTSGVTL